MALPRKNRMTKRDFTALFRGPGRPLRGRLCSLRVVESRSGTTKFGVAVQSSAVRNAVERNRIRRAVADEFQRMLLRMRRPLHIAVIVHRPAGPAGINSYIREIRELLSKSGIMTP